MVVGNPIVDASHRHLGLALARADILDGLGLDPGRYCLMTTHREENVDSEDNLRGAFEGVSRAALELDKPCLFLAHPRTTKRLEEFGLTQWVHSLEGVRIHEAVGYLDFLALLAGAALVFTDSGGVQQEACIHNIPCVTLRENTEWTETVEIGANRLAGCDPERIVVASKEAHAAPCDWSAPFGDGTTAAQIAQAAADIMDGTVEVLK